NICIKDKRGKTYDVVVTNYDLFQIVNQERNLDLEQCNKLIKKTISSSNPFALKKELKDYDGGVFLLYKNDNNVKSIAKKGKDYFIKYYLGPADERGGPPAEDVNIAAIIKELIKWHVPVKSGDDGAFYSADLHFKCDN
ncbi:MAG: hypothetical protein ABUT20_15280, partial [Bacteroidota bacterium]